MYRIPKKKNKDSATKRHECSEGIPVHARDTHSDTHLLRTLLYSVLTPRSLLSSPTFRRSSGPPSPFYRQGRILADVAFSAAGAWAGYRGHIPKAEYSSRVKGVSRRIRLAIGSLLSDMSGRDDAL